MEEKTRSCLVVTYGPVPTSEYQTVEGGGMRAWGLAKGLQNSGVTVTIAVNNSFPQKLTEFEGISLVNWSLDENFETLMNTFDSIVVSYCMGDPSIFIADKISDDVQLILDVYVPIYIEVAARDSDDVSTELKNYLADIKRFNHVLKRGDYFLCANSSQKTLYMGVLSSLGVLNPRSYRDERILVVPFGIHNEPISNALNPYRALGIKADDFVVLWFGGLYPWFRVDELLTAIDTLSKDQSIKFVFVGGKNPFNANPDFVKQYDKTVAFAEHKKLKGKSVHFVDWVDFDDRINWYSGADVVISINQPGDENEFSWRTRVMDYVWGELAIITNGGDPLSEQLLAKQAAIRLDDLSANSITLTIQQLFKDRKELKTVRDNVRSVKASYFWDTLVLPVVERINTHALAYKDEVAFKEKHNIVIDEAPTMEAPRSKPLVKRTLDLARRTVGHARKKGLRSSAKVAYSLVRTQSRSLLQTSRAKQYVFISHPVDNTGAPVVLLQIIEEFAKKFGGKNIHLVAPVILDEHKERLRRLGVRIDKAAHSLSFRMIRLQLGLRPDDFVLINTIAIYDNYREFILLWLRLGRLKHAYWFIHEDKAQIPAINHTFQEKVTVGKVQALAKNKKLSILVPSERIKDEYNKLLGIQSARAIPLRVEIEDKYRKKRPAKDYAALDFLIVGTPSDGRKGQMIAVAAFSYFLEHYYTKSPKSYRDFRLHLVAMKDDYISQQIVWMGTSLLHKHLVHYQSMPRPKLMELTARCNAVICCSLNESFGLSVAEGMTMGHIVLRNNTAGVDEQLQEGKNGYAIDHTDAVKFAAVIEKVLNKETNSDEDLQKMGATSPAMVSRYNDLTYISEIAPATTDK